MTTQASTETVQHETAACMFCQRTSIVELTAAEVGAWLSGVAIQDAMPERGAPERELIRSGIHPECWAESFG